VRGGVETRFSFVLFFRYEIILYDLHFTFGTAVLITALDPRLADLNGTDKWSD